MGALSDTFTRSPAAPPAGPAGAAKAQANAKVDAPSPKPLSDGRQANATAKALTALAQSGQVAKLDHQAWSALGDRLLALDDAAFIKASQSLSPKGLLLVRPHPGLIFALDASGATALVEPATKRVRLTEPEGSAKLYTAGRLSESIAIDEMGEWATVKIGAREERWNLLTGEGQAKGKAIAIPMAKAPAGEAPRKVAKLPPNRLVEPEFGAFANAKAYAQAYDEAVVKAGGRVLEALAPPMSEADMAPRYNCHSFATTGGKGDLADPFLGAGQARWLNFPFFQLREQGFEQLPPTVRVRPGDVVLYRDAQGEATHTGLVREVDADGNPTQVESKFGAFGLYLHGINDVPGIYGEAKAYYRKP